MEVYGGKIYVLDYSPQTFSVPAEEKPVTIETMGSIIVINQDFQYEEIYNRYAHISVDIQTDSPTYFELVFLDHFKVNLNINDLKTLDVEYILSSNDLEQHNDENQTFNLIEQEGDYKIYQVVYSEDV